MTPICDRLDPSVKPCANYAGDGLCKLRDQFRCIEYVRRREPELSYSQVRDWTRCKRRWYYASVIGLELVEVPDRLKRGSLASDVLDLVHSGDSKPLAPVFKAYRSDEEGNDKVQRDIAALQGLFEWYIGSEYGELRGRTQYPFEWKEVDYPKLRGYLDLVIMTEDSIAYEFKYTSNHDDYDLWTMGEQLAAYLIGVPTLQRITVRTILVPTLRPGKSESQSQYIERIRLDCTRQPKHYVNDTHYWRSELDMEGYKAKMRWIAREIVEAIDRGIEGCYTNTNACYAQWECEYLPACKSGAISETLYRYKEKNNGKNDAKAGQVVGEKVPA